MTDKKKKPKPIEEATSSEPDPFVTVDTRRFPRGAGRYGSPIKDTWTGWPRAVEVLHQTLSPFEGRWISASQLSTLPLKDPILAAITTLKRYAKENNLKKTIRMARNPDTKEKGILISESADQVS